MSAVHDPLSSPTAKGVVCDDLARMADNHAAGQNHDLDALTDQAPGHGVAVRVEIDRAVGLDLADQIPQLPEWGTLCQRAQRLGFFGKTLRWCDACCAVFTLVGDLARPAVQMRLECCPALEPAIAFFFT